MFWIGWFRLAAFVRDNIRKRLSFIFRNLGNRNRRVTAKTLTNRGEVYYSLTEYYKTIGFYQRTLTIYQKIGDCNQES